MSHHPKRRRNSCYSSFVVTDPCLLLNDLWLLSSTIFSLVIVMNLKLQVANNPAGSTATQTIVHRSISSYMGWSCELAIHARVPLLHLPSCTPCHANFLLDSLVEIPCMYKYAFIFCLWCCPHCYNESYNKKRAAFAKAALKHCKMSVQQHIGEWNQENQHQNFIVVMVLGNLLMHHSADSISQC